MINTLLMEVAILQVPSSLAKMPGKQNLEKLLLLPFWFAHPSSDWRSRVAMDSRSQFLSRMHWENGPLGFAITMLHVSMHPAENVERLLGLAWAFAGLHDIIASSPVLSASSRVHSEPNQLQIKQLSISVFSRL